MALLKWLFRNGKDISIFSCCSTNICWIGRISKRGNGAEEMHVTSYWNYPIRPSENKIKYLIGCIFNGQKVSYMKLALFFLNFTISKSENRQGMNVSSLISGCNVISKFPTSTCVNIFWISTLLVTLWYRGHSMFYKTLTLFLPIT